MIINTGSRTDIPAYYGKWFLNRLTEGSVCVRNPYNPVQVTRYRLDPDVVDCLVFCTKNPAPMLELVSGMEQSAGYECLSRFRQLWYVTITPYGRDVEPNVPPKEQVMESLKCLSSMLSPRQVIWRYDPIFISEKYPLAWHIRAFDEMARNLKGYTQHCVISFIDLYAKTVRNFPGVKPVDRTDQEEIGQKFAGIGRKYGIRIQTCCEGTHLEKYGVDCSGCMSQEIIELACDIKMDVPVRKSAREGCDCLLGGDIGMYNTCNHGCLYCYANYDRKTVWQNMRMHNPESPFLIGSSRPEDIVRDAKQTSWINGQLSLF